MRFQTKFSQAKTAKRIADRENVPTTQETGSMPDDEVAAAVLRIVGMEPDNYADLDPHPSSLDLPAQRQKRKTPRKAATNPV
jgi:hypothetical protein